VPTDLSRLNAKKYSLSEVDHKIDHINLLYICFFFIYIEYLLVRLSRLLRYALDSLGQKLCLKRCRSVAWSTGEDDCGNVIVLTLTGARDVSEGQPPRPAPSQPLSCIAEGRGIHNENF
jgi:hypothetical protein